jgi:hypothetical protein
VSATPIPPLTRQLVRRETTSRGREERRGARRIALLAALAVAVWVLIAPFDGIVLFVAGLAALAAYAAATHPQAPPARSGARRPPRPR